MNSSENEEHIRVLCRRALLGMGHVIVGLEPLLPRAGVAGPKFQGAWFRVFGAGGLSNFNRGSEPMLVLDSC